MSSRPVIWRDRATLKEAIRSFFGKRDYLEVDTPIAVLTPGTEVHLRYFSTSWHDIDDQKTSVYLRSSPELHMKRVLATGEPRIFQLAPCFRNHGEVSDWHHPEFTMLEWYEAGISFTDYMAQTEDLLRMTHGDLKSSLPLPPSFTKITVAEAFKRWADLDLIDGDPDLARKALAKNVISVTSNDDFETAFFKIMLEKLEPEFQKMKGLILYDYPPSQAALATVRDGVAKRFEFYINGIELCNAFEELLDSASNQQRFQTATAARARLGYEQPALDPGFIDDLEQGLPPCCGNALGFDRWLAMLRGEAHIKNVIPFRLSHPFRIRSL